MNEINNTSIEQLIRNIKTELKGKSDINHNHENYCTSQNVKEILSNVIYEDWRSGRVEFGDLPIYGREIARMIVINGSKLLIMKTAPYHSQIYVNAIDRYNIRINFPYSFTDKEYCIIPYIDSPYDKDHIIRLQEKNKTLSSIDFNVYSANVELAYRTNGYINNEIESADQIWTGESESYLYLFAIGR